MYLLLLIAVYAEWASWEDQSGGWILFPSYSSSNPTGSRQCNDHRTAGCNCLFCQHAMQCHSALHRGVEICLKESGQPFWACILTAVLSGSRLAEDGIQIRAVSRPNTDDVSSSGTPPQILENSLLPERVVKPCQDGLAIALLPNMAVTVTWILCLCDLCFYQQLHYSCNQPACHNFS